MLEVEIQRNSDYVLFIQTVVLVCISKHKERLDT